MYKMAELKGTKTEANLQAAFAGESQAHTKYPKMKENTLKSGTNCYTMKKFQTQ